MAAKRGPARRIETPEKFNQLVDEYLAGRGDTPITLTGALLHLGLYSRQSLDNYEGYDGFSGPVKRLRAIVARAYEERLHGSNPTGAIFALKNMGWSDKQEHEHAGPNGGPLVFKTVYEDGPSDD